MVNKCYVVVYDYYDEDENTNDYKILGVYNTREKAKAKMLDQAEIIEHNNTFDSELCFDHKEVAEHYVYFYNDEDSTQETVMIHEKCIE